MRVVECSPLHHLWMGKDGIEQDSFAIDLERRDLCADVSREGGGGGGCSQQALYGEASPRGPTPF